MGETGVDAYTIVSKEQGETTTVLSFANAVGKVCPPVVIHKGSRVQESWCLDAPVRVMVRASVNGWINKDIFLEYATRWLHNWKLLDRPHLLLLDAHKSHVYNIWFLKLMKEINIGVLAIPSHTSHKIQPLDDAPFAKFKTYWNENLLEYLFGSVGCGMPKMDFFQVFWPAWKKAMTVANIQAGFRQTGIFPVNANAKNPALPRPSRATDNITNLTDEGNDNLWICYISVDTCIVHCVTFNFMFQAVTIFLTGIRYVLLLNFSSKSSCIELQNQKQCVQGWYEGSRWWCWPSGKCCCWWCQC